MYNEDDYKVIKSYYKDNLLVGALLEIKGANFKIERVYSNMGVPTNFFKFVDRCAFNNNNEFIEIGWSTCQSGMDLIGNELNLKFKQNSLFSISCLNCRYEELV